MSSSFLLAAGTLFKPILKPVGHHSTKETFPACLEAVISDSLAVMCFVVSFFVGHNWCKRGGHEVETWERNKVGLELVHVDVQFTIESDGCSHGGHDLADDVVQV